MQLMLNFKDENDTLMRYEDMYLDMDVYVQYNRD